MFEFALVKGTAFLLFATGALGQIPREETCRFLVFILSLDTKPKINERIMMLSTNF